MSQQDMLYLVSLIQAFAEKHSNPVLEVLAGQTPKDKQKYPQDELHFDNDTWRSFYHCHASPGKSTNEHGHFHLFSLVEEGSDKQWAHVAGLSMNYQGQPIDWFTVNQWVTDGVWLEADRIKSKLENIVVAETLSLLEQWLLVMLSTYKDTIYDLLDRRDKALKQVNETAEQDDIFSNRDIYLLSTISIDLQADLNKLTQAC
jgi:hypothetical protein